MAGAATTPDNGAAAAPDDAEARDGVDVPDDAEPDDVGPEDVEPEDDAPAAPRLSQPAVEMVSDLQAAIGAFEITSPIQPLAADEGTDTGLDGWNETGIGEERDVELDEIPTAVERTREPMAVPAVAIAEEPEEPEPEAEPAGAIAAEAPVIAVAEIVAVDGESVAEEPVEVVEPPPPPRIEDPVATALEIAESGDRARAVAMLRTIVAETPADAPARRALLKLVEAAGDAEGALQLADAGLERTPDDVLLLIARAALLATKARLEHAEIDLRRALRAEESNIEALTMLGLVCTRRGRWREAIEPLRKAADLAPDRAAVHYYLGEALNRLDRLPEALSSYEMAAALEPKNWRAHKGVGIVLDRLARPKDAAEAYRRARETHRT